MNHERAGGPRSLTSLDLELVAQPLAFLAGAHVDRELPPATFGEHKPVDAIAAIAQRCDRRPGTHAAPAFGHLCADRHKLGRLVVLGADIEQQRERLANLDAQWL